MKTILMKGYLSRLVRLLNHKHMRHGCIELISALCEYCKTLYSHSQYYLTCPLADAEEVIRDSDVVIVLIPWLKSPDDPMRSSAVEVLSKMGLYDNAQRNRQTGE
jgi:hypothetical protein